MSDFINNIRRYLAGVYLERNLPKIDRIINTIYSCSPKKNSDGVIALSHIFFTLTKKCRSLEDVAYGTNNYSSELFSSYFGMEAEHIGCPLLKLIEYVIQHNKSISSTQLQFLTDFVHGVLLFNCVKVEKVKEVDTLLSALDDTFYDFQIDMMEKSDDDDDELNENGKEFASVHNMNDADFTFILNDFATHVNDINQQMKIDTQCVSRAKQNFEKSIDEVITRLGGHRINWGEIKEDYDEIDA